MFINIKMNDRTKGIITTTHQTSTSRISQMHISSASIKYVRNGRQYDFDLNRCHCMVMNVTSTVNELLTINLHVYYYASCPYR